VLCRMLCFAELEPSTPIRTLTLSYFTLGSQKRKVWVLVVQKIGDVFFDVGVGEGAAGLRVAAFGGWSDRSACALAERVHSINCPVKI